MIKAFLVKTKQIFATLLSLPTSVDFLSNVVHQEEISWHRGIGVGGVGKFARFLGRFCFFLVVLKIGVECAAIFFSLKFRK